jgi:hypothetical protein
MRGYDTVAYARTRLLETIVMREKQPVMILAVEGVDDDIELIYNPILESKGMLDKDKLSNFDLNPVSLGYVNHKNYAHYLMRTPMRKDWRQGLRMLNIVDAEGSNPRLISYRSMAQTMMGKFPTFKSTLNTLSKGYEQLSLAFHKDFSIKKEGGLEYKGIFNIGSVNMDNGNVLIEQSWVREAFEEAMEKAA